eukprot:TRINITY_DN2024_c0_g1_i1.p1 TRINITY_DN2024_c0_g1~~TRINITY_DN2024_c0_g1_i1.p1  ORF type:complete len:885 (-),score=341.18 TRINITY_DN2024_c0_g1_i1:35-2689(-)
MAKILKGPSPRLDISKKGLEVVKDSDLGLDNEGKSKEKKGFLSFFAQQNRIHQFPQQLIDNQVFHGLKVLYLNGNNIEEIPKDFGKLNQITKLHLENNQIKTIPASIGELKKLKKFFLGNNQITHLPDTMGSLIHLQILELQNNQIRVLTPFVAISGLKELKLFGNPIESPPPFTYNDKPLSFLMAYLRDSIHSIQSTVPSDEYVYQRSILFKNPPSNNSDPGKNKRNPKNQMGNRAITKTTLSGKFHSGIKKARSQSSSEKPELIDDSLFINQNHLLYFLTSYGLYECQGHRDYMEDKCIALPRLKQREAKSTVEDVVNLFSKVGYFGVFDGHGGVRCANYLSEVLHSNICNTDNFSKGRFEEAIRDGFRKTDEDFLDQCRKHFLMDGSTCAIAMIVDSKLITAHAGDSRIVLCRDKTAVRLTEDHKPDRDDELARVEKAGGEVIFRGNCFRVAGDLAMSRSFGDLRLKEPLKLVLSEPEITIEELTPNDKFIIIASDGLWDVLSDQKAVDIARRYDNPDEAAKRLVDYALSLGTMDNTTAIVVKLNWHLDFLTREEVEGNVNAKQTNSEPTSPETQKKTGTEVNTIDPSESDPKGRSSSNASDRSDTDGEGRISTDSPAANDTEDLEGNLERVRTKTFAFRDSLQLIETLPSNHHTTELKPISDSLIKLQITIPRSEVIKLMQFNQDVSIAQLFKMLYEKEKSLAPHLTPQDFKLVLKNKEGEVEMDQSMALSSYSLTEDDHIELKFIGNPDNQSHYPSRFISSKSSEHLTHVESSTESKIYGVLANVFVNGENNWVSLHEEKAKVTLSLVGKNESGESRFRILAKSQNEVLLDVTFGEEATLQKDSETFYELRANEQRYGFSFEGEKIASEFDEHFKNKNK